MALTHEDAAEALRIAETAEARSATLRGYQSTAPHLILWGAIYAVGYTMSYFQLAQTGWGWGLLIALGSAGSTVIGMRDRSGGRFGLVIPTLMATFLCFIIASAAIMQPQDPRQMAAFVPLVVAVCYVVLGLGTGSRITLTGVALGGLTLIGYFGFPAIFMLWMAVVAGGTLILSGLWLRRV